jgi:N-hydroxyarylamine O-acetyltransferase
MIAETFNLTDYCQRIGYTGELRADLATVQALMQHQLRSVPFENLDVLAGKPISLNPDDIVAKIVGKQRGGYCYEVNGLFAMALQALQIPYQFVAARPMFYPMKRPRTHMALLVTLDGGNGCVISVSAVTASVHRCGWMCWKRQSHKVAPLSC